MGETEAEAQSYRRIKGIYFLGYRTEAQDALRFKLRQVAQYHNWTYTYHTCWVVLPGFVRQLQAKGQLVVTNFQVKPTDKPNTNTKMVPSTYICNISTIQGCNIRVKSYGYAGEAFG